MGLPCDLGAYEFVAVGRVACVFLAKPVPSSFQTKLADSSVDLITLFVFDMQHTSVNAESEQYAIDFAVSPGNP